MPDTNPKSQAEGEKKEAPWASLLGGGKGLSKFQLRSPSGKLSFIDRLRQFRRKDLAFILAGLGILFMAPLADFLFTGSGSDDSGAVGTGWGLRNALGGLGGGGPFDYGLNGMAPGGALGSNGEVITPLDARDPASLILGLPGMGGEAPKTPVETPSAPSQNSFKDSFGGAAAGAARAAVKSAGFGIPHLPLGAAGLRALGFGGGSHAAAGGAGGMSGINAWGVPTHAAGNSSLSNVLSTPGYKGSAARNPMSGGGFGAMKTAADRAAKNFDNVGSAAANLQKAAAMPIVGAGGGNTGGGGAGGKSGGAGQTGSIGKTNKSIGQSLAYMAAKQNLQHAIDLYWKKQEAYQMFMPNLLTNMGNTLAMAPINAMSMMMMYKMMGNMYGNNGQNANCTNFYGNPLPGSLPNCVMGMGMNLSGMGGAGGSSSGGSGGGMNMGMFQPLCVGPSGYVYSGGLGGSPMGRCTGGGSGGGGSYGPGSMTPAGGDQENAVKKVPGMASPLQLNAPALCGTLKSMASSDNLDSFDMGQAEQSQLFGGWYNSAVSITQMGNALTPNVNLSACGGSPLPGLSGSTSLSELLAQSQAELQQIVSKLNQIEKQDVQVVNNVCVPLKRTANQVREQIGKAQGQMNADQLETVASNIQNSLGDLPSQFENLQGQANEPVTLLNGVMPPLQKAEQLLNQINQNLGKVTSQLGTAGKDFGKISPPQGMDEGTQYAVNRFGNQLGSDISSIKSKLDELQKQYDSQYQAMQLINTTLLGQNQASQQNGLMTQLAAYTYFAVTGQQPQLSGIQVASPQFLSIQGQGSWSQVKSQDVCQKASSIVNCAQKVNEQFQKAIGAAASQPTPEAQKALSEAVNAAAQGFQQSLGSRSGYSQWVGNICTTSTAYTAGVNTPSSLIKNQSLNQALTTLQSDVDAGGMPAAQATVANAQ